MKKTIVYLLVITISIIALATSILYEQKHERKLPILNPTDVNHALVDSSLHNKGVNHTILDFQLTIRMVKMLRKKLSKEGSCR